MIYLDYNATTPIAEQAADAMLPFIRENFGNPSSSHAPGRRARQAVETARQQTADLIGASPEEILFTSGGSESNNMVIKGVAHALASRGRGRRIIISAVEHPAVTEPCSYLEKDGFTIVRLPVDHQGLVSPGDLEAALTKGTILVSVMHANNETGTIQPVRELAQICQRKGVLFHTDASQTLGKIPADVKELGADFLTLAGHKLYAPKGIGALYIRQGVELEPLIHGASQEGGRRAGTENVIFAAGLGKACEIARQKLEDGSISKMARLTEHFLDGLKEIFQDDLILHGHPDRKLPNTLFITILGRSLEQISAALPDTAFSTGSACHSGSAALSPVLRAMGTQLPGTSATIRFSLGRCSTDEEIDLTLNRLRNLPVPGKGRYSPDAPNPL